MNRVVGSRAALLRFGGTGDRLAVVLVGVAVWQALHMIVGSTGMASPAQTLASAAGLLTAPDFWVDVAATGAPFLLAVAIEIVVGVTLGVFLGLNAMAREIVEPVVVSLYSVPKVVFYPIILVLFGIGIGSEVVFALLHGILPIILFTSASVRTIRPVFMKTARVIGLSWWRKLWSIAVPAAFPEIFSGIRIGISVTLLGVLLCEMFGSKNGLGYRLVSAIGGARTDEIMAIAMLLVVFAVAMNLILLAADRRFRNRLS